MFEFLTLAITETTINTGEFNVIAMETKSQSIASFGLHKENIISPQGEIFWDIGFTTFVNEKPQRKNISYGLPVENSPYVLTEPVKLGSNKIETLKSIFEAKCSGCQDFFVNNKNRFCILKVNRIEDMPCVKDEKTGELKHYLKVRISGLPAYQNPLVLRNKDYRWINFWNWIYLNGNYNEKKSKYMNLLNHRDKNLYLILYRHYFKNGPQHWIVGMHWL